MGEPLRVERRIAASPEAVFGYLTTSQQWSKWQGTATTIDARPGGEYTMLAPNGNTASGEVVEIVPNRRITFTWGWEGHPDVPPGSSTVSIELEPDGEHTIVTLTHTDLPTTEVELHHAGWTYYLGRLSRLAGGHDVGPDTGLG